MRLRRSALESRVDALMERVESALEQFVPLRAASMAATGGASDGLQSRAETALAGASKAASG